MPNPNMIYIEKARKRERVIRTERCCKHKYLPFFTSIIQRQLPQDVISPFIGPAFALVLPKIGLPYCYVPSSLL